MRYLPFIFAFMLAVIIPYGAAATTDTLRVRIAFEKGVSSIERDYRDNGSTVDSFLRVINALDQTPDCTIRSVSISTGASPEGDFRSNERLSVRRARSIMDCILEGTTLDASVISVHSGGEDWSRLLDLIMKSGQPWIEEALSVIATSGVLSANNSQNSAQCKRELKRIQEGIVWRWMEEYAFERLRSAEGTVTLVTCPVDRMQRERDTLVIRHESVSVHRDTVWHLSSGNIQSCSRKGFRRDSLFRVPAVALRSNLLAPLMNIGVEVPLSNRFSIGVDWYYPWAFRNWIDSCLPSQMYCFQTLFVSVEARWWLGKIHSPSEDRRYRLRGHSIGVSISGGYYDFEYDGTGQQGEFLSTGLDYLYALPLGKGGAHLEFTLGVGVAWNPYRDYNVRHEGGYLIAEGEKSTRIIPVPKAGISICIPINAKQGLR